MVKKPAKKRSDLLTTNVTVAQNRRARFDYELTDHFEAGIALHGTEVKSLRQGLASINEAYVRDRNGEIYLLNATIQEYKQAGAHLQHEPTRPRKLLLRKKEIDKLIGAVHKDGMTVVPTRLYFDARGMAKMDIALARGKKQHDKRATEKQRDWNRQKSRVMKENN